MKGNKQRWLWVGLAALCWLQLPLVQAQETTSKQVAENISVLSQGDVRIHTYFGVSNSHIIETANELRLVDAQLTLSDAQKVKAYIDTLGKPLKQVILSHNHPDHWFGAEIFQAHAPVATSEHIQSDLAKGGGRYLKILAKRLGDNMPKQVVVPDQTLALGAQTWDGLDVIVEEYAEQEAHHSLLIRIPSLNAMIGQDLFYNRMFLVASERERNKNWVKILQGFKSEVAADTHVLTGHGANTDASVFDQDIEYLQRLESLLAEGKSKDEVRTALHEAYPDWGGKGMLEISLRNLFNGH